MANNSDAALYARLELRVKEFEKAADRAVKVAQSSLGTIEKRASTAAARIEKDMSSAGSAITSSLGRIGAIAATALSVKQVQEYADAWTTVRNRLAAAGAQGDELARQQAQVLSIAQATRSDLEPTADLYAKLTRAAGDLGKSQSDVAKVTETVNKAFVAGGSATQERIAGILQLSQALGSGVLQGDELRSLRENAPLLAKAIADAFGVSVARLKDLGEEGRLTADKVFDALLKAGSDIDTQFGRTTATVADGFTKLKNSLIAFIGQVAEASGVTRDLGFALSGVASAVDSLSAQIAKAPPPVAPVEQLGDAYRQINAALTEFGNTAETIGGKKIIDPEKIEAARQLFYQFRDGGPNAIRTVQELEQAVRDLGASIGGINIADRMKDLIAQAGRAKAAVVVGTDGDADQTPGEALRATEAKLSAQRTKSVAAFISKQLETINLTKDELDLRKKIEELRTKAAKEGAPASDEQLKDTAQKLIAADERRKAEEKAARAAERAGKRPLKATADSRLDIDIKEINDRAAALRAEAGALSENDVEQEARRISLQQQQRALRDLQEEARRTPGATIPTQLDPSDVKRINAAAQSEARANADLRLGQSLELLKQRTQAVRDQIEVEKAGTAAGRERALMLEAQREAERNNATVSEARTKAIKDQAQAEADLAYAQQERQAKDRIADLQTEIEVLNLGTNATKAQITAVRELNRARQEGTLTPEREADIRARADQEGALQKRIDGINAEREAYQALGQEALSSFQGIINGSETAGQAMLKLASRIAEAALQAATLGTGPLAELLGTKSSGGLLGAFGGLFGGGASAGSGITAGGTVTGVYADGGMVRGPGTGRSDSVVARVSNGEYVVNARQTRRYGRLLAAINENRMPRFATGGMVGGSPSLPAVSNIGGVMPMRAVNNNFAITVDVTGANGDAAVAAIARQAAAQGAAQAIKVSDQQFGNRLRQYQRNGR